LKSIKLSLASLANKSGKTRPGVITSLFEIEKAGYKLTVHDEDGNPAGKDVLPSVFSDEGVDFKVEVEVEGEVEVEVEGEGEGEGASEVEGKGEGKEKNQTDTRSDADEHISGFDYAIDFDEESNEYILQTPAGTDLIKSWKDIARQLISTSRTGLVKRDTRETKISVELNLDGTGTCTCHTGLGFFDHMLEQIARHGGIDLNIRCDGDLHVDEHHTIEDVALALGTALDQAFGNRAGIERYAFVLPMDESRATVALDLSGRPYLVFEANFTRDKVGDLPTEMVKHFFYSLAMNLRATLHIEAKGENDHHIIEACFKGFARCLKSAKQRTGSGIPSSKGIL
jgi:imidazoleglycerol phosphate dehydratase HisB